jgi:hypothetical protein
MKFAAYAFLIALYAVFAWFGKVPVDGFVTALTGALAALGVYHVHQSASKQATDAANHANPVPAQRAPTTVTHE